MITKNNKKKKILILITVILVTIITVFTIYVCDYYRVSDEMYEAIELLDTSLVERYEDSDQITYSVDSPIANIVFIPGGKIEADSYEYLAINLAMQKYDVTIYKPIFRLAIFTPNHAKRFLSEDLDNIVIGHSLGGVVASMMSEANDLVNKIVILGSYSIADITDKEVLLITAE
ncbi:MAG: alpha/beta hydrolase, partial [Sphaerochaetaceae bacterium]|nr:alpha/beta hydrolase [Sphaerochaetaceae bacterium]